MTKSCASHFALLAALIIALLAVRSFFDDCDKNGYKFALGGEVVQSKKGYFLPITIIDNPPDMSKIVQEERKAFISIADYN